MLPALEAQNLNHRMARDGSIIGIFNENGGTVSPGQ